MVTCKKGFYSSCESMNTQDPYCVKQNVTGRSRKGPKPKWVNPCGIDPNLVRHHVIYSYHDVTPLSDQELIQNILLSAKNALVHSDDFKEKFVSRISF